MVDESALRNGRHNAIRDESDARSATDRRRAADAARTAWLVRARGRSGRARRVRRNPNGPGRTTHDEDGMAKKPTRPEEIVARFVGAWNAETLGERRRLLESTCNQQTHFASAYGEHTGIDAQLESIASFRRQFPRGNFSASLLKEHHGWILMGWTIHFGDGRPPLRGVDVGALGQNDRFVRVISFSPIPGP